MINKNHSSRAYLYSIDSNVVDLFLVSALSLRRYSNDKIVVFGNCLSKYEASFIKKNISNVSIIDISKKLEEQFSNNKKNEVKWALTKSAFGWFFIGDLVDEKKVLFIDADTYFSKDPSGIFEIESEKTFAAVPEMISSNSFKTDFEQDWIKRFGWSFKDHADILSFSLMDYNYYVNSGVVLIDVDKYILNNYKSKFFEWDLNNGSRIFNDQDVLNAVGKDDVFYLDVNWNYTKATYGTGFCNSSNYDFKKNSKNAIIIHYAGRFAKPIRKKSDPSYPFRRKYFKKFNKVVNSKKAHILKS